MVESNEHAPVSYTHLIIIFVVKKCRRVGMADDADSKSVAGNRVRVQVPPPALHPWQGETLKMAWMRCFRGFFLYCSSLLY